MTELITPAWTSALRLRTISFLMFCAIEPPERRGGRLALPPYSAPPYSTSPVIAASAAIAATMDCKALPNWASISS